MGKSELERHPGGGEQPDGEKEYIESLKREFSSTLISPEKAGGKEETRLPPISIDIIYRPHMTEEDWKGTEKLFSKADIYVPENFGCTPEDKELNDKLTQGAITPKELLRKVGRLSEDGEIIDPDGMTAPF